MKKLILFSLIELFVGQSFGQVTLAGSNHSAVSRSTIYQMAFFKGDTLIISDPSVIHFIKLGDKVYQIVTPAPTIQEVKPQALAAPWGMGILADTVLMKKLTIDTQVGGVGTQFSLFPSNEDLFKMGLRGSIAITK